MAVYIVTGKLGSGKTLLACSKIQEYLQQRRKVVTNIDVDLTQLCSSKNDYSRVIRIPDLPTREHMESIGLGCDHYDESNFGGIFLDEAGVWLNSRDWNGKGRTELLEFFLYLRKRRWDLFLIVQNIKLVDKQVRDAVAEHVVYLTRWDRVKIPFVTPFLNFITLGRFNKLPKVHHACVKYGATHNAMTADNWYFIGSQYYGAYNTTQEYDRNYQSGIYSLLPPAYLKTGKTIWTKEKRMKLTKIYFRKYSRFVVAGAFFFAGIVFSKTDTPSAQSVVLTESQKNQKKSENSKDQPSLNYSDFEIKSYFSLSNTNFHYVISDGSKYYRTDRLPDVMRVLTVDECHLIIKNEKVTHHVYCPYGVDLEPPASNNFQQAISDTINIATNQS